MYINSKYRFARVRKVLLTKNHSQYGEWSTTKEKEGTMLCVHQYVFNGNRAICLICLKPYQHSNQEIEAELRKRGYNESDLPEMQEEQKENKTSHQTEEVLQEELYHYALQKLSQRT